MTDPSMAAAFPRMRQLFRSAFVERHFRLETRLAVQECRGRLREDFPPSLFGGRLGYVSGRVTETKAVFSRRIGYGNSYRTLVTVRLQQAKAGTQVLCVSAPSVFVRGFNMVWFGFILFWWVGVVAISIFQPFPEWWIMVLFPIPMLTFGFLLVTAGRWLARNDDDVILAYLRRRLEAS
jgi:hypothetical protein